MDITTLVRDPERVHAAMQELEDGRLVAKKGIKIYIPTKFNDRGLADVGIETYIIGIYAIVVEDRYYGVSLVNAKLRIEPTSTIKIMIDGEEYYEFYFEPGSTVVADIQLVRTDTLVYRIYDEIIAKGRVPWYLGYAELGKIFDTAKYHADANIGTNHEVTELIVSMIARNAKDRHQYYRTVPQTAEDVIAIKPAFIGLRSVTYAATNTTNKLAGSYFHTGIVSALVSPATRVEKIEGLLRL